MLKSRVMTIVLAAFIASLAPCAMAADAPSETPGVPVFWIGTAHNNVFDRQVQRYIGEHAGLVVLNALMEGPTPAYNYKAIVSGIHADNPSLPVFMYGWGTHWLKNSQIGSAIGTGYLDLGSDLLRTSSGKLRTSKDGRFHYGDVANPKYRKWYLGRVERYLKLTGTDGIALDGMHRTPGFVHSRCTQDPSYCASYRHGVELLLREIATAIRPKPVIFNGLWNASQGLLEDQEKLLPYATGASIEFFGRNPHHAIPPFSEGIQPYLDIIAGHPGIIFLVFGRGSIAYSSYQQDYLWQRYLYCAYLLVANSSTHFHYHTTFQVPSVGRANGISWYADWDIPTGAPIGSYQEREGLYFRKYSKAIVLLVPLGGTSVRYPLNGNWYTPEGKIVSGKVIVQPGEGLLLSRFKPSDPTRSVSFSGKEPPGSDWPGAQIKSAKGVGNYLALTALPPDQIWQHDLMLDPVHALNSPRCVHFELRSLDASLRLLMVAAIDDRKGKNEEAVVQFSATPKRDSKLKIAKGSGIQFRIPGRHRTMPYLVSGRALQSDGAWHEENLCADSVFPAQSRYRFDQWKYIRIRGAADLGSIRLDNIFRK